MTRLVSWSEISTGRDCPFKWDLAYRQQWVSADEKRPLAIGKLWHEVLERHYGQLMLNADPSAEDLMRWVAPLLYDEAGNQTEYQELVSWMYAGHVEHWGLDPQWEILAVEHAAEMWLPTDRGTRSGFKLKVKIDLVVRWKGKIWIIDHKSGANLPKQQELALSDQFGLYAWALRQLGKPVFGIIYNAARTNRLQRPMTLDERFSRELMYRTDTELETLAVEAWRSAKNLYGFRAGEAPRNPDPDRCGWKCLSGDQMVMSPSGVYAISRRQFEGRLITINTQNGKRLSSTPEHPILTQRGWVPAGLLIKGDYVISNNGLERFGRSPVGNNVQYQPIPIEQVFDASAQRWPLIRVPYRGRQFDGQAATGEVEVIRPYGLLSDEFGAQPNSQVVFTPTDVSGVLGSMRGVKGQRFGYSSDRDLSAFQLALNGVPTAPHPAGDLQQRQAVTIESNRFINIKGGSILPSGGSAHFGQIGPIFGGVNRVGLSIEAGRFSCSSQNDSPRPQFFANSAESRSRDVGQFSYGGSSQIKSDQVVSVELGRLAHNWVYDLSTPSSWFWASDIVSHNCQFLDACLASRRGSDAVHFLESQGMRRDSSRH